MRIAFYAPMKPPTDPVPSGDRLVARLLVEALARTGATVDLAARFRSYDRGDGGRQARLEQLGARLAERLLQGYRRDPATRPDLWFTYHLYHKAPDHLGPRIADALGIPYAVAEASHAPKQAGGAWDLGFRAAERAIGAADRIYCLNPGDAACLLPVVRASAVLAPLPLFIDTAPFRRDGAARRAARRRLDEAFGFDAEAPLILTVAMMRNDQKLASYTVLAEALAGLGTRRWSLLVVGAGPAEALVRQALAPFGDRVRLAGLLQGEALRDAYAGAGIFAWPAVKEAVGAVFLEAAAAGLAVVAGRSGGIATVLDDGVTGLVVPAGGAAAMAGALARLLDDPAEVRRMGAAAAARARRVNDTAAASAFLRQDLEALIRQKALSTRNREATDLAPDEPALERRALE